MSFEAFTAVTFHVEVFWVVTPHNVDYQHFRGACCLHFRVKLPVWEKMAEIQSQTGEGLQVPLANRKCRASDLVDSATSVRKES
jgi:hypothetical protein